jgi:hypothetical protein
MLLRAGRVLELPGWRAIATQARPNSAPRPSREETAAVNYCRCSWSMADIQLSLWECITLSPSYCPPRQRVPGSSRGTKAVGESPDVLRANRTNEKARAGGGPALVPRARSRYFTPVYVPVQVQVLEPSAFPFPVQPPLPVMALNFPVPPVILELVAAGHHHALRQVDGVSVGIVDVVPVGHGCDEDAVAAGLVAP